MKKKAFIPISALVGALLLAIIAAMTPFVAERNLAHAQISSDIATLSNLRVSTGTLSPDFDPAKLPAGDGEEVDEAHAYEVNVRNSVKSLTVSATKTDRNASVTYTVNSVESNTGRIDLGFDTPNVVLVTVTAEDRTEQKFYQVTVNRANRTDSNDATLSTLSVTPAEGPTAGDAVSLSEELDEKFAHTVDLTYAQDSVAIAAGTSEAGAVVTVKKGRNVIDADDDNNYDVDIDVGDNTITVDVLAPDFVVKKTYTLTINRARRNASDNATLKSLRLSPGYVGTSL